MEKLDQQRIDEKMAEFAEWSVNADTLQRTFGFDDFAGAMEFVGRVAELAEEQQHHPDIMIRYSKVTLTLSTHDAGGITEKDFEFARCTDNLLPVS
ncbi:MAG: 4a-hydroxytetrahydrobiopterin dehydratase [Planctomycetota bacterium]|jgi:4a-hydroxytetrahydrobiopterin dehydratase